MRKILSVKQAAKLLGVSTNTLYKYLNEGRISATRGAGQGNFRIPLTSLESFLGTKIEAETIEEKTKTLQSINQTPIVVNKPVKELSLPTKIIRLGLIITLVFLIIETIYSANFSLTTNLFRLLVMVTLFLLAYQHGGFSKQS